MKILLLLIGFLITSSAILPSYSVPGSGILYGTDAGGGNLITVNPSNAITAVVGNMGIGTVPSLAVDPNTGKMYAGTGAATPFVYTVNPGDGSTTLVGNSGLGVAAISAMDFDSSGTLYASVNIAGNGGSGADHLATIDKNTGLATVIGPYGSCTGVTIPSTGGGSCTLERMEAIAFASDGTLYGATTNGGSNTGELYTINTSTGQATLVALILDGTGVPHPGGIASLQFACDGTLYAGTAKGSVVGYSDLLTINPSTGIFSKVGQALLSTSLGALAFENGCSGKTIGGELLPIDTTALLVAGAQSSVFSILGALAVAVAIGTLYYTTKSKVSV